MADQLSPHIRWHRGSVARPDREALLGQRGMAVWLTGLSGVRRAGEVAKLFVESGAIVLASFISPTRAGREAVRSVLGPSDFLEVYVQASLATCEGRDVKGLYGKARAGEISDFTGLADPYEPPEAPDLVIDTESLSVGQGVAMLVGLLLTAGKIGREAVRRRRPAHRSDLV